MQLSCPQEIIQKLCINFIVLLLCTVKLSNLACLACLLGGLYILPMFFSLFFFISFMVEIGATSSLELLNGSSPTFQGLAELCKGFIYPAFILAIAIATN